MLTTKLAILFGSLSILTLLVWLFITYRVQYARNVDVGESTVTIVHTSQGEVVVPVELAVSASQKIQGLSDRESLPNDSGMLFIWKNGIRSRFIMRRMNFPLDIIFIKGTGDAKGEILHIAENLPACPGKTMGCATASPKESFRYVLEVNGGFAETNGFEVGDTVSVNTVEN